jgi:hypothetical protein
MNDASLEPLEPESDDLTAVVMEKFNWLIAENQRLQALVNSLTQPLSETAASTDSEQNEKNQTEAKTKRKTYVNVTD